MLIFGDIYFNNIKKQGRLKFKVDIKKLSLSCKDFISKLLRKNASDRLSANDALNHPWLLKEAKKFNKHLGAELLNNLGNLEKATS